MRVFVTATADGDGGRRPRLLVVDDDDPLRHAVTSYLEGSGFDVAQAASAKEAYDMMVEDTPELVVLDVMMPGTDGLELLRQVRGTAQLRTLPVVLLTARGFTRDRISGYEAGCNAYITKPFDADELVAVVRSALATDARYAAAAQSVHAMPAGTVGGALMTAGAAGGTLMGAARLAEHEPPAWLDGLTSREREVLQLVSRGRMNKEIARALDIGPRMVEKYVSRLLAKTGTATRTELARLAVENRIAD